MFDNIRADIRRHNTIKNRVTWALINYRFGVWSMNLKFPPARWGCSKIYTVMRTVMGILTGISLDRHTKIGEGFHIVSESGRIAIHEDTVIGDRVGISHNVTLGNNMVNQAPVIGNDVFIGCGASILGGVNIGDGARIAANSLVMNDVPAGATAIGVPAQIIPGMSKLQDYKEKRKKKKKQQQEAVEQPSAPSSETVADESNADESNADESNADESNADKSNANDKSNTGTEFPTEEPIAAGVE
ncbi:MAG: serine O-acetyltransferase [Pirellulaceae bacterium]|jgi:serine O-acetyltransferase